MNDLDTIAAIATPSGRGGIGVIRLSGKNSLSIALEITKKESLKPRFAHYANFWQKDTDDLLDQGLILYFPNPNSFTGEDVVEIQGHGGPVVLDSLMQELLKLGVRQAKPGEFSERAFLNDKLDLAQAEAIADLIDSASQQAAKSALRSLQGDFSKKVHELVEAVIHLRIYIEAAIDFPEEEIDFLSDTTIVNGIENLIKQVSSILKKAEQGARLREGLKIVIAGKPNAGKSSLLNALSGRESAIVTHIAGTTRDVLKENILIDGIPLHIIDTAGLRETTDEVEKLGIARAGSEINDADQILLVIDQQVSSDHNEELEQFIQSFDVQPNKLTLVLNKVDLTEHQHLYDVQKQPLNLPSIVPISAKTGQGIDNLREHLKTVAGVADQGEQVFTARRRHLEALNNAYTAITNAQSHLNISQAGELAAEELRIAQEQLGEITGQFTSDDLLGRIFSSFCIGK